MGTKKHKTHIEFVESAGKVHNYRYLYISKYEPCTILLKIKCREHGIFFRSPVAHLKGSGCPYCSNTSFSKKEIEWLNSLNFPKDGRNLKLKIGRKIIKPDGFDPKTNTIYEFYGDYWHGNPKVYDPDDMNYSTKKTFGELYKATMKRESLIKKAGYKLITIWESEWDSSLKKIGKKK